LLKRREQEKIHIFLWDDNFFVNKKRTEEFCRLIEEWGLAKYFRKTKVRLAIDIHEKGYYGQKEGMYEIGTSYGNKSYGKAYHYMTISILTGKKEERSL